MSSHFRNVHFIGVGGAGLSALAHVALGLGLSVTGSDQVRSDTVAPLEAEGMRFQLGHAVDLVRGADLVVVTSAVRRQIPELTWAREHGVTVWRRHEFLAWLAQGRRLIAVAGTHGKTSTTALLAHILRDTGRAPTAVVGGTLADWGRNAQVGQSDLLVLEADEYDRTFLALHPRLAVITTIEHDHPDCYPTEADFDAAFLQFVQQSERVLACGDDRGVQRVLMGRHQRLQTYGKRHDFDWYLAGEERGPDGLDLEIGSSKGSRFRVSAPLWGKHSALNAMAAFAAAVQVGVEPDEAGRALARFGGVLRRFHLRGHYGGVNLVDDYAHHPTEIRAVLDAARQRFPERRTIVLFQPHTYSRLEAFFPEFVQALAAADLVLVLPVFASREADHAAAGAEALAAACGGVALPEVTRALPVILQYLQPDDVLLNLNAGDALGLSAGLAAALDARPAGA